MTLCHSNPPVAALSAEPFTVAELDAMSDSSRIWATVLEVRREAETAIADHEAAFSHLEYDDMDMARAQEEAASEVKSSIEGILDMDISNAEKIEKLEGLL